MGGEKKVCPFKQNFLSSKQKESSHMFVLLLVSSCLFPPRTHTFMRMFMPLFDYICFCYNGLSHYILSTKTTRLVVTVVCLCCVFPLLLHYIIISPHQGSRFLSISYTEMYKQSLITVFSERTMLNVTWIINIFKSRYIRVRGLIIYDL